jgi:hypothetical protein
MKEYILLFRMDITTPEAQPTPKQMESYMVDWMEWIDYIADKGQLADGGNHLSKTGRVIRHVDNITEEPYTAEKESVAGYILIYAMDFDDALHIANKCPILKGKGTSVEVRETANPWK